MSGQKTFKENQPGEMGNNSPRRTIVGGRPPEKITKLPPVPVGLQSLLRLASVDPKFCEELIRQREKAAHAAGIELTPSETAMLRSITADQIRLMANQLPQPAVNRRSFLKQAAKTAVLILGGSILANCVKHGEPAPARKEQRNIDEGIAPTIPPEKEPTEKEEPEPEQQEPEQEHPDKHDPENDDKAQDSEEKHTKDHFPQVERPGKKDQILGSLSGI